MKFVDFYPTKEGTRELAGSVDAVYFSHTDRKQYFLKDENVWENTESGAAENRLRYVSSWYYRWYDICDIGHNMKAAIPKVGGDTSSTGSSDDT